MCREPGPPTSYTPLYLVKREQFCELRPRPPRKGRCHVSKKRGGGGGKGLARIHKRDIVIGRQPPVGENITPDAHEKEGRSENRTISTPLNKQKKSLHIG